MVKRNRQRRAGRDSLLTGKRRRARATARVRLEAPLPRGATRRASLNPKAKAAHVDVRADRASNAERAAYQAALRDFEAGIHQFHKQNFQRAAAIFEKLATHPAREIADRARVHLQQCKPRVGRELPAARTAEDYYLHGIAALNNRQFGLAVDYLIKANKLQPNREHVHYALGAAYASQGDTERALQHLATAIQLRPANRILARSDEDFQAIASEPRFRQLVTSGSPPA